jgi:hypothetical protein
MHESFLYYIWQFQYFDKRDLLTTDGEALEILNTGFRNHHAGPDFSNSRVKIGEMVWIGNVEIHVHASEWLLHKHDRDGAYNNVILHVVWNNDKPIICRDGSPLKTLELKHRVSEQLILQYRKLTNNPETIPCSSFFPQVNSIAKLNMFDKTVATRLETKANEIGRLLERNNNDWEETVYQLICRNFGFKVNPEPFQQLSRSLPYRVLMKHADKQAHVEALLFGQAGFLEEPSQDDYHALLKREYSILSRKFNLAATRLDKAQWRFLRLRPANFPTTRIAQLAAVLGSRKNLFSTILEASTYEDLIAVFSGKQHEYWQWHYQFFKTQARPVPALGVDSMDNLIINTVVPILICYGKAKDLQRYTDQALDILQMVPSEKNSIVELWRRLGVNSKSAFYSQALIELHNNYCLRRRCLDCSIGFAIIQTSER